MEDAVELLPEEFGKEEAEEVKEDSEKFVDMFGLPADSWEDWSTEDKTVVLSKAVAKEITRRFTLMRILKFLLKKYPEPQFTKEIAEGLEMSLQNLIHNLRKLVNVGVVEKVQTEKIDLRTKYYQIADRTLAEKLIRRYHYLMSFKFAKLIPEDRTVGLNELTNNVEFKRLCKKYFLSEAEAVKALEANGHVEAVYGERTVGTSVDFGYLQMGQKRIFLGFRRKKV